MYCLTAAVSAMLALICFSIWVACDVTHLSTPPAVSPFRWGCLANTVGLFQAMTLPERIFLAARPTSAMRLNTVGLRIRVALGANGRYCRCSRGTWNEG